jgi:WD40 repeat protein
MFPTKLPGLVDKRYRSIKWLGQGAMGRVLLALDRKLEDRKVAIKFLNPELLSSDNQALDRFHKEMAQLVKLDLHPNIVKVFDFSVLQNGTPYLVMNYIGGQSLQDRISANHWPGGEHLDRILHDLVDGLIYTHQKGIIHRDLKPSNILIDAPDFENWGRCVIGDYGVSVFAGAQALDRDAGGTGTPGYRSPEQRSGNFANIDQRADQFALAAIAWHLFTRQTPPVQPDGVIPEPIPDRLRDVLLKALAEKPENRYEKIEAFAAALFSAPFPPVASPYKGLYAYERDDAALFFGREPEVSRLLEGLAHSRFWAVLGASGSGKSSLVRAGVISALKLRAARENKNFEYHILTPGQNPLAGLAAWQTGGFEPYTRDLVEAMRQSSDALAQELLENARTCETLLVVDQFEQLTSTEISKEDAAAFVYNIINLIDTVPSNVSVIILLRDDFLGSFNIAAFAKLRELISAHQVWLGELDSAALRRVIEKPAETMGLLFSEDFVEKVIEDASGQIGALPLLSQALYLTWMERKGRRLMLNDYRTVGGIHRVIELESKKATENFRTPEHKNIARRMLLRLIQFNSGRPDTRRQQTDGQILSAQDNPKIFEETLQFLSEHRLIVIDQKKGEAFRRIDLAHEVLITRWEQLVEWIKDYREKEQTRRYLEAKVDDWKRMGSGRGGLLDEIELAETDRWLASEEANDLGYQEALIRFIETSRQVLQAAEKREKRFIQIQRVALMVVTVLLLIALCAGVVAGGLGYYANTQRLGLATEVVVRKTAESAAVSNEQLALQREQEANQARATAVANEEIALLQARLSRAGELAAHANQELNPQRSLLLAVEALKVTQPDDPLVASAYQQLFQNLNSIQGFGIGGQFDPSGNPAYTVSGINSVLISPDSRWLVAAGKYQQDNPIRPYIRTFHLDAIDPGLTQNEWVVTEAVHLVGLTSTGMLVVHETVENSLALWDLRLADPAAAPILVTQKAPKLFALSQDGNSLAGVTDEDAIYLWDLTSPQAQPDLFSASKPGVTQLELSPDRRWLAVLSQLNGFELIDLSTMLSHPLEMRDSETVATDISFSPDSRYLLAHAAGPEITIFNLRSAPPALLDMRVSGSEIKQANFSPLAGYLAVLYADGDLRVWGLGQAEPVLLPAVFGSYQELAKFEVGDLGWLVTGVYGDVTVWDLDLEAPASKSFSIRSMENFALAPGSNWLVTSTAPAASTVGNIDVSLWDLSALRERVFLDQAYQGAVGTSNLPDLLTRMVSRSMRGHEGPVLPIRFSPDGSWLLTTSWWPDGTMRLWDMRGLSNLPEGPDIRRAGASLQSGLLFDKSGSWLAKIRKTETWLFHFKDDLLQSTPIGPLQHSRETSTWFFSQDQQYAAARLDGGGIEIWKLTVNPPLRQQEIIPSGAGSQVLFSPDSSWLVLYNQGVNAQLWRMSGQKFEFTQEIAFEGNSFTAWVPTFSEDSRWLATPGSSGQILLWDLNDTSLQTKYPSPIFTEISKLIFNKTSDWVAVMVKDNLGQPVVVVNRLADNSWQLLSIDNFDYLSSNAAFTPDGQWLVLGASRDNWFPGDAVLINLNDLVRNIGIPVFLADESLAEAYTRFMEISSDGRWLAVVQELDVHLWDLYQPGKTPIVLSLGQARGINDVTFSQDSRWLAIAGNERSGETVIVADLTAEGAPAFPVVYNRQVFKVEFSPDSKLLYTDEVLVDLNIERLIELACAASGRNLSQVEWHNDFPGKEYRLTCPNIKTAPIDKQ